MKQQLASVSAVFGTTELLEHILRQLPIESLFTAMRVNQHWHAAITGSKILQRKLFFTSIPYRGLLLELNPPGTETVNHSEPDGPPRAVLARINRVALERFRLGHFDQFDPEFDGGVLPMVSCRWIDELKDQEQREKEQVVSDARFTPSWRRIFLTQPPARRVEILMYENSMFQQAKNWVECEDGVTLGMIYDKCKEMVWGKDWRKRIMGWSFEL